MEPERAQIGSDPASESLESALLKAVKISASIASTEDDHPSLESICRPRIHRLQILEVLSQEWGNDLPRALDKCLQGLSRPESPSTLRMDPKLRNQVIAHLETLDSPSLAQEAALPFAERITLALKSDFEAMDKELAQFEKSASAIFNKQEEQTLAQQTELRNKKSALEKAIRLGIDEGLPGDWNPSEEVVVVRSLLRGVGDDFSTLREEQVVFSRAVTQLRLAGQSARGWLMNQPAWAN